MSLILSFLATGRVVGQSVSVAIAEAIFAGFGGAAAGRALISNPALTPAEISALQQTFATSFHAAFIACAAIAAFGVLTSLVRGKEKE